MTDAEILEFLQLTSHSEDVCNNCPYLVLQTCINRYKDSQILTITGCDCINQTIECKEGI